MADTFGGSGAPIDFNKFIGGEEALAEANRKVRELGKGVAAISDTITKDAGRITAALAAINASIAEVGAKGAKLNFFNGEDKAVLLTLAQQLGALKKQQGDVKEAQAAQIIVQRGLTDSVKAYNSELAKQKDALRAAVAAQDVEGQKKAAAAIRQTALEAKDLNAALRGANSGLTAAAGSYDALVINNQKLTATLRGLEGGLSSTSKEAAQLRGQIAANNEVLLQADKQLGLNYRNVGNYAQSFQGLIAELAKARAAQSGFTEGSAEAARQQMRIAGFQTAAQRAAAQAGLSYEQAEAKIQQYTAAVQPLTTALVRLEKEQVDLAKTTGEDTEAYRKIGFQIQQTKKEIDDVAAATAKAGDAQKGLGEQLGFTKEGFSDYITQLAVGAIGLQAIATAAGSVFQANVEYSRNLAEVRKTTGLTADEAERLAQSLKQLDSPTNLAGLLKIASVGGQLGIAKEDLLEFTKAIDTAVQALGNDFGGGTEAAEQIATTLGKIGTVFGKELGPDVAENILRIGSAVNELGAVGSATAPFLTDVAQRVGGIATQSGLALKDVLAYASVLQETGSSAEVAGSSLGRLFSTLSTKTEEAFKIAQKANPALTLKEFTRLVNTDFNSAIQLFLKGLNAGNASTTEVAKRLGTLKLESGEARTAILTLAQNTDLFAQRQKTANDQLRDATSLAKEAAVNVETLGGSVDQLKNEAGELVTSGLLGAIFKGITDILKFDFKLFNEGFRGIGDAFVYVGQKIGLVDKPLTDYTTSIVSSTLATRKQTAAQQELLKSYTQLEGTTTRTAAQELELAKTRGELLKQFGTDDGAAIQASIDKRKAAAESNIQFFKKDIAEYDKLIADSQAKAAAAQNTLNSAPRNADGAQTTRAGQSALFSLALAEKNLTEQQRLRGQAVAALAKLEAGNTQAKKDGAAAADEETAAELQLDRAQVQRSKNRVGQLRDELADNEARLKQLRDYQAQQGKLLEDRQITPDDFGDSVKGSEDLAIQIQRDGAAIRVKIARAEAEEKLAEAENDRVRQLKKKDITQAEITDVEQQAALRRINIRRVESREIAKIQEKLTADLKVDQLEFKVPEIDYDAVLKARNKVRLRSYQDELTDIKEFERNTDDLLTGQLARREITANQYDERQRINRKNANERVLALDKKFHKDSRDDQRKYNEDILNDQAATIAKRISLIEKVAYYTQAVEGSAFAIKSNMIDADLQRTQEAYDNEIKAAGDNSAAKLQIQQKYDKQLRKLNYDKAKAERDQAAISILINTAVAVAKDLATYGFLGAIPFVAADLALGALQELVVLSKPLPAYFKGRKNGPAEFAIVSDRGPELVQEKKTGRLNYVAQQAVVRLGEGDKVFTASETTSMLAAVGLNHQQAQQPAQVAAAFGGAAKGAAVARESTAGRGYDKLAENLAANTAALKKIQTTKVTVHRGSDADVETSNELTRYVGSQRRFQKPG